MPNNEQLIPMKVNLSYIVLIVVLTLFTAPISVCALTPSKAITHYNIDFWTTDEGLPQNSIQDIIQAENGYLWLGTQEGLARFDGINFTVFDKSTSDAFKSNHVTVLHQTADGNLWIGTTNGLLRYDQRAFINVSENWDLNSASVTAIIESPRGNLWVGTDGGGLIKISSGHLEKIFTDRDGLLSNVIDTIISLKSGDIVIGSTFGSIQRFDGTGFSPLSGLETELPYSVRVLYADSDEKIWIGTAGSGLLLYKQGTVTEFSLGEGPLDNIVTDILRDHEGNLWVTTFIGIVRFHDGENEILGDKQGLAVDLFLCMQEDHESNLWIGTSGSGLVRLKDDKFTTYSTSAGLSYRDVFSVCADLNDTLWVATAGGGLNRFKDGLFRQFRQKDGLLDDTTFSVLADSQSNVWVGSNRGLNCIRDSVILPAGPLKQLEGMAVIALFEDSDQLLWIGTDGDGLFNFDGTTLKAITDKDGLSENVVICICEDHHGHVWVGTDNSGLNRIAGKSISLLNTSDGLSSNSIMSLFPDGDHNLWIGTYDSGLNLYRNGHFYSVTVDDGLPNDGIFHIAEDKHNRLWFSCNQGIYFVQKELLLNKMLNNDAAPLHCTLLGTSDGMKAAECNGGVQPAGARTSDGTLWFPTIDGIVSVDPLNLIVNKTPPLIEIEKLIVDGTEYKTFDSISLGPGKSNFEFHYTGLSYSAPERVGFRYKLEPFNEEWIQAGKRRIAYYTNLPPGTYTFSVYGRNSDGYWTQKPVAISFYLAPYFYQTGYFYVFLFSLIIMIIVGSLLQRIRRIRLREKILEKLVSDRSAELLSVTRKLEQTNLELQRLSTIDSLTGVANRRQFDEFLSAEWKRSVELSSPLSLLMIDIDYFKRFNDTYGHQSGDDCLRRVALTIQSHFSRPGDLTARYGGEEFVVVLFNTNHHGARRSAERVRKNIEGLNIPHAGLPHKPGTVTVSIGVATTIPDKRMKYDYLIAEADKALYQAKASGRNIIFSSSSDTPSP